FKASHQAAINAMDVDGDGRLDIGYEVPTGNAATPVVLTSDSFLINVQLGGKITLPGVFRLTGVFLFSVDSTSLKAFVAAGVGVLPGSASFDPTLSAALAGHLTGRFTTNSDGSLTFTIDRRAPRLEGGFDPAGSYFMVAIHGNLVIAGTFTIGGDFQLKVSGS